MIKGLMLLLCLCFFLSPLATAGVDWLPQQHIKSQILKEQRAYRVSLPENYEQSSRQYPLLLLLDGDHYGDLVANNAQFLANAGDIPEHVIVALSSVNRLRDFTPTDSPDWHGDGGAEAFSNFINNELLSALKADYRIGGHKVIWGHSAAGLYVMYHLYTSPTTFDAYLVNDGSLDWDNGVVVDSLRQYLQKDTHPKQFLYFNNSYLLEDIPDEFRFVDHVKAVLKANSTQSLRWVHQNLSNESHATIPLVGSVHALRALYEGYRIPEAIVYKGLEAMKSYVESLSGRIGAKQKVAEESLLDYGYHALFSEHIDIEHAIETFKYTVSLYPESIASLEGLYLAYEETGNKTLASAALNQAIDVAKRNGSDELQRLLDMKQGTE